jgi:peroxiredoxin
MPKGLRTLGLVLFLLAFPRLSQGAVAMPDFSLPAASDGGVVTSEAFQGKTLLITFFATWCSSCLQEIPTLKALQEKFQKQGFAVVALSVDEGGVGLVAQLAEKKSVNAEIRRRHGSPYLFSRQ